jgi:hypothetical protein
MGFVHKCSARHQIWVSAAGLSRPFFGTVPTEERFQRGSEGSFPKGLRVVQLALFADRSDRPEGLRYQAEFVSQATEAELIAHIEKLPLQPFQFGAYQGK